MFTGTRCAGLHLHQAAIDKQLGTGDIAGIVRGQERYGLGRSSPSPARSSGARAVNSPTPALATGGAKVARGRIFFRYFGPHAAPAVSARSRKGGAGRCALRDRGQRQQGATGCAPPSRKARWCRCSPIGSPTRCPCMPSTHRAAATAPKCGFLWTGRSRCSRG